MKSRAATPDDASWRADLTAGLSTALVLVPQSLGYALLAGLPPVVGLRASTFALVPYVFLGTSAAAAIGPVAMDSLLTAAALGDPAFAHLNLVALAALLAVLVGLVQFALAALRLGHVANFLSMPVTTGFLTAAALLIALSQASALAGLPSASDPSLLPLAHHLLRNAHRLHWPTVVLASTSIAALFALDRLKPHWPRAPIVLALLSVLSITVPWFASVPRIGSVPLAWPRFEVLSPDVGLLGNLLPYAVTIAFVGFVEDYSTLLKFADTHGVPRPARELAALGAGNVVAGLSGGYPVTVGLSRSAVLVRAGAKTKRAGLFTALGVLVFGTVLAPLLGYIPKGVLAAVVVTSVTGLVDVGAIRRIATVKRSDGLFAVLTLAGTLAAGFQWGIAVGILASVANFLFRSTRPHVAILGHIPGTTTYRNVARYPEAETVPGMLLVRIDSLLYFGNATFLRDTMARLEAEAGAIDGIVLDASGIGELDASGELALTRLVDDYDARGITFAIASVKGPVRDVMKRSGLWQRLGRRRLYLDVHSAVEALRPPITRETSGGARAISPAI